MRSRRGWRFKRGVGMKREEKLYLTTDECAELIHRSPGAVRNLVMRNQIPYRKPGGRLVFIRDEIIEWMQCTGGHFEIEKDIAIPPRGFHKYPFDEMEPGDSFFIPLNGEDSIRLRCKIKSASKNYGKKYSKKFTVRYMKQQGGIRCWREDGIQNEEG